MSAIDNEFPAAKKRLDLESLQRNWALRVSLGLLLTSAGLVALAAPAVAMLATTAAFGCLLLLAGIGETVGVFCSRRLSGSFFHLLAATLSMAVGILFVWAPFQFASALTMLLAFLLMVGGIFKIDSASTYQFDGWNWPFISGIADLILGIIVWLEMPISALWILGVLVGISLAFRGLNWIGLGIALRAAVVRGSV